MQGGERSCRDVDSACGLFAGFWIWCFYILFWPELGNGYIVKVPDGYGVIYMGMWAKKVPIEFINDGNISDGSQTFLGATLSSNDYDGEIQDI